MLDTSHEFEFDFEKVICTDLLLQDHKNSLTVQEIEVQKSGFIWQGINGKIDGTYKNSDLWYSSHPSSS